MSRFVLRRLALVAALATGLVAPATPAAGADDPIFLGWTSSVPPSVGSYLPTSEDDCRAGAVGCVNQTIERMERRFDDLATGCGHDAVFALAYLRTTQEYAVAAAEPDFFADPRFLNHQVAVFADFYFRAYDDWAAGRPDQVPPAWRIAFDAAAAKRVNGSTNLNLGMSAHVNRDLPFVLASIGLVRPDGTSRKPDHDQVNVFLNRVVAPLIAEEAARFDPTMDDTATPYGLSYTATMQLLVTWREEAWRNAERLVAAPDEQARARVASEIEAAAAETAEALVASGSYQPPLSDSSARDAHCAKYGS